MRIIIHLKYLPPPYGGVTVGNKRLLDLLEKQGIKYLLFNISKQTSEIAGVININPYEFRNVLKMYCIFRIFQVKTYFNKYFKIHVSHKQMSEYLYKAFLISKHLDIGKSYSAYVNHLGKNQIIYQILKLWGYDIQIHTYLHGYGLIYKYNRRPNLYKKLINMSDSYMVASSYMLKEYERKKDKINRVEVVSPFIADNYYNDEVIHKKNEIVFVGSLSDVKNPLYVIDELRGLNELLNSYKINIIGTGPLESEIKNRIQKYGLSNVELLGQLDIKETERYLERAKYLIMPSTREAFGRVIVEAMAKRTVPIVSKIGGMPEIVSEKSGFVFELKEGELHKVLKKISVIDFDQVSQNSFDESLKYKESVMGKKWIDVLVN